jgi:hypothetical protein
MELLKTNKYKIFFGILVFVGYFTYKTILNNDLDKKLEFYV